MTPRYAATLGAWACLIAAACYALIVRDLTPVYALLLAAVALALLSRR